MKFIAEVLAITPNIVRYNWRKNSSGDADFDEIQNGWRVKLGQQFSILVKNENEWSVGDKLIVTIEKA